MEMNGDNRYESTRQSRHPRVRQYRPHHHSILTPFHSLFFPSLKIFFRALSSNTSKHSFPPPFFSFRLSYADTSFQDPLARLETCPPGHACDMTIHDSCFSWTGTRLRWRTSGIHLGLGILLLPYPGFAILPTYSTSFSFPSHFLHPFFLHPTHDTSPFHSHIHSLKSRNWMGPKIHSQDPNTWPFIF